jgi:hypothetical protein
MTSPDDRMTPYVTGQPTPNVTYPIDAPAPIPPAPKRRRSLIPWIIIGALAVALAAVLVIPRLGDEKPSPALPPATLTAVGALTLDAGDFGYDRDANLCWGAGGYGDIEKGASVTITDAAGAVIGVGSLVAATPTQFTTTDGTQSFLGDPNAKPTHCDLSFAIPNIPAGKGFYGVEVSHRGSVKYPEAALNTGLGLTLG